MIYIKKRFSVSLSLKWYIVHLKELLPKKFLDKLALLGATDSRTTKTSPDMLNSLIMNHTDSSRRTKGHYDLYEHNCQHFTHFAVNQLN